MSQTVDVNILLYASNDDATEQQCARSLMRQLAGGPDLVVLLWPVVMGYIRIATHSAVFSQPLSHADAAGNIGALMSRPHVSVVGESERFWGAYLGAVDGVAVRGNGVPDAHLAALMVDHGIDTIWSRDRDFLKYRRIAVKDPFDDRYKDGF